jgi:ABC-2 type transport system permease protein
LFPLGHAIRPIQVVASLDPLSYGVDGLRGALAGGGYHFGDTTDLAVMCAITAFLLAAGSYLFSRVQL